MKKIIAGTKYIAGACHRYRKICWSILTVLALFNLLDLHWPVKTNVPYSTIVEARDGSILHAFQSQDDKWRLFTKLEEITPVLQKAVILKEDRFFFVHPGINPVALVRATFRNITTGKRTSGASTITMQVVRLLERRPRTVRSKLVEMLRALQLEWHYSKKEILQLYLNLVPYGGNIEGVKSASMLFFGKTPGQLSLAEATALAVIPNRPTSLKLGRNNVYIEQQRNKWLQRWQKKGYFSKVMITDALEEPLAAYRRPMPKKAPHLSRRLLRQYPGQAIIRSSISAGVQSDAEDITARYMASLRGRNIYNAAVLIIDNKTRKVVAYVGSNDFGDNAHSGQVDGVRALRSPGSTLKPFVYALAIDKGICTPRTTITDVPVNFSGYSPENYDEEYRGQVTMEQALAQSLNIPAVKTLHETGLPAFLQLLEGAAFKDIGKKRKLLGLSVVLGGCGTTLEELSGAYCALANYGSWAPLSFTPEKKVAKATRLLSAEAAWLVTKTLTTITRPDVPRQAEYVANLPRIAWKTGTSYGRRDAWSIGYNSQYTVAVWTGNFSGEGVPELTGADIATPLMIQLFNQVARGNDKSWLHQPKGLDIRYVCSQSGLLPGDHCTDKVMEYYLPGISPSTTCTHIQETWTDLPGTMSYCTSCLPSAGAVKKPFPNLPQELAAWYDARGIPYDKLPPHNPGCQRIFGGQEPRITQPSDGITYYMQPEEDTLLLQCQANGDVEEVFWYVNDRFIGSAEKNSPMYIQPTHGRLKISCTDDKGRNSTIEIFVEGM